MADATATATDTFHQIKGMEKVTTHPQNEHHEVRPEADSEESNHDLEKHASGYDLSEISTEDGENVVTVKTWAVVVVRYPSSVTTLCS
jgi:hypothetical protein